MIKQNVAYPHSKYNAAIKRNEGPAHATVPTSPEREYPKSKKTGINVYTVRESFYEIPKRDIK